MNLADIRSKFLQFYKARGHAIVPSASLVPENDPTTLFVGSGMQPLVPYLLGETHPEGARVADAQKSFRLEDVDDVGDNRHTTFFEMLGNWSFGDYWKEDQLAWIFEFLTAKGRGPEIDPRRLYVTIFSGGDGIARDDESVAAWRKIFSASGIPAEYAEMGAEEEGSARGMRADERIFGYGAAKNWWSRSGTPSRMPAGEPGGPDSEIFYDFGTPHDTKFGAHCHPNCDCGRFLEIGNSVFMAFRKEEKGFSDLPRRNVDFGGGLERIAAASENEPDIFRISAFRGARAALEHASGKSYEGNERAFRVVMDHVRAAVFLAADGVAPANKGRGYVLRRLIRRAVRFGDALGMARDGELSAVARAFIGEYKEAPPLGYLLEEHAGRILASLAEEEKKFRKTLREGLKELEKMIGSAEAGGPREVDPARAFFVYQTYGFPLELIQEELAKRARSVDARKFEEEARKHQELSRTASAGMFKGGLADASQKTTRLHTAHHLLLKALQAVLGPQVKQRGSNITQERLRMDFSYEGKMTEKEQREAERIVNEKIAEDLPVIRSEMPRGEAEGLGAEREFGQKYPERVSVYSIGPKGATPADPRFAEAFSIEFCGGPHVSRTGEIGRFRIIKEEAVGAGIRRIRGVIE